MLINSTAELKEFLPASVALDFRDIRPKIRLVERETIIRVFSKAIYDSVQSGGLNGDRKLLQELLSEATAHLALLHYLSFGQVQISSAGVQIASNENLKTAFEWQIDELKTECSKQGWAAIESALELLEKTSDESLSAMWKESDSYLESKDNLVSNLRQFEKFVNINHSRVLFNKLVPVIADQQNEVIMPCIGDSLASKILNRSTEEEETRKKVLEKAYTLAAKALTFHAMARGFLDTLLVLSDNGPMVLDGMQSRMPKAIKSAPTELVQIIAENYKTRAAGALRELVEFCQSNVNVIPEFKESSNYISEEDQLDHIPRNDPDWGIAFF
jgi:hypothetical protein